MTENDTPSNSNVTPTASAEFVIVKVSPSVIDEPGTAWISCGPAWSKGSWRRV